MKTKKERKRMTRINAVKMHQVINCTFWIIIDPAIITLANITIFSIQIADLLNDIHRSRVATGDYFFITFTTSFSKKLYFS